MVEGELGRLAGIGGRGQRIRGDSSYTRPDEVVGICQPYGGGFVGDRHRYKPRRIQIQAGTKTKDVQFRYIGRSGKTPAGNFQSFSTAHPRSFQNTLILLTGNGGNLADAVGIPEEMLRQAARLAVCKINIDSDLRLAMTAGVRQHLAAHPENFDPRQFLIPGRDNIRELVKAKIIDVLGCEGKA